MEKTILKVLEKNTVLLQCGLNTEIRLQLLNQ